MSEKRKYKKRLIWSDEEERFLLGVWKEYYAKLRGHRKNYHIYEKMASELNKSTNYKITTNEVRTKVRNLCLKFRSENKRIGPSGQATSSWVLFNEVKEILAGNNNSINMELCKEEGFDDCSIYELSQTSPSGSSDEILQPSPSQSPVRKRKKATSAKKSIIKVMMKLTEVEERKVQAMEERNRLKAEEIRIKADKLEFLKSQTK